MTDRLTELCARELEKLFENPVKIPAPAWRQFPSSAGRTYWTWRIPSQFLPMIVAALAARAKFYRDAPERPILPLRQEDCEEMMNDDRPQVQVVGLFGDSWRYTGWDRQHPSFRRLLLWLACMRLRARRNPQRPFVAV